MSLSDNYWGSTGSTMPFYVYYNFSIFVQLAPKDKCADPNCCVLVQWVTCAQTTNGSLSNIGSGAPCDGSQHIDMAHYNNDDPSDPSNQHKPTTGGPNSIRNDDRPSNFPCNNSGDVLAGGDSFVFKVYDTCNGMRVIRSMGLDLTVTGTCPDVTGNAAH